jgi:tripartite-type tricarboxylate transporter receptor subunit TctC
MKKRTFRDFIGVGILFIILCTSPNSSWAAVEKYPSHAIDLFCAHGAGGQTDLCNRALARGLEKYLGVTVVPGNKTGGGGVVATTSLINSRPDGYTMALLGFNVVTALVLGQGNYSLDDLTIVGQFATFPGALSTSADSPWKTFQEFIDYVRKNPGVKYAHPGVGSSIYMRMENLNKNANLKMVGVPFKSDPEIIAAILGKHVPVGIGGLMAAKEQADAGKMRILLSFDPPAEVGLDPTIPCIRTAFDKSVSDKDLEIVVFLAVPRKTPKEIVQVLEQTLEKVTKDPEFINDLKKLYMKVSYLDSKKATDNLFKIMAQVKAIVKE